MKNHLEHFITSFFVHIAYHESRVTPNHNLLLEDIGEHLVLALGGEDKYQAGVFSPYYHKIGKNCISLRKMFNPLTAGAASIRVSFFIST